LTEPAKLKQAAENAAEDQRPLSSELNGILVHLGEGRVIPVNRNVLRDLITRHIASVRLVNRGDGKWEVEYYSFEFPLAADTSKEPNERVLIDMIAALLGRVVKGSSDPLRLLPQHQQEVRARLKIGEPQASIGRSYGVDIDTVKRVGG
jgi:hypothetical protein